MSRVFERLLDVFAALSAAALAFMAVAICYEVALRQVFQVVPVWVNDVTAFILLGVTFAGGAYVLARDGHTRVDILLPLIKGRPRAVLDLVSTLLGFAAAAVLAAAAFYSVLDNYERGTRVVRALQFEKWIVLTPILIGSVLIAITFLQAAWRILRDRVWRHPGRDSA